MTFFERLEIGIVSILLGIGFILISVLFSAWFAIPGAIFFLFGIMMINVGLNKLRLDMEHLDFKIERLEAKLYALKNEEAKMEKNLDIVSQTVYDLDTIAMKKMAIEDAEKFFPEETKENEGDKE